MYPDNALVTTADRAVWPPSTPAPITISARTPGGTQLAISGPAAPLITAAVVLGAVAIVAAVMVADR